MMTVMKMMRMMMNQKPKVSLFNNDVSAENTLYVQHSYGLKSIILYWSELFGSEYKEFQQ